MSDLLTTALLYASHGWNVFPLHTPDAEGRCSCHKATCDSIGKHPRTLNGLLDATTDPAIIKRWWAMWEDANIGIVTGADSGIIVLDVDPRHGGDVTLKQLLAKNEQLTEKVYAKTGGGGWHIVFQHPGFRIGNIQGTADRPGVLGPGIDVRGDGGYIVAPPSLHASGQRYAWGVEFDALPVMPAWLCELLAKPSAATPFAVAGEIADGQRNQTLTSMAGSMRRRGMSEEAIYSALTVENEQRCNPPLVDADVRKIAHSIARYEPTDPAYIFPERTTMDGERPDGIYFAAELFDRIDALYEQGLTGGLSTGFPSLDYHYTVKPGQWTVITGAPSAGKTAVLDAILVNLVQLHGWKFCITSFENQPLERHAASLMSIWAGQAFGNCPVGRMDRATRDDAKKWLDKHFVFVLPSEGGATVGGILERAAWVQAEREINGVVIDPWNELEHRRFPGITETEYVSQSLTRMRRFARDRAVHLWLVAHPTKLQKDIKTGTYPVPTLYDISGSAHFRNKADCGISVWRDVMNEKSATQIHVQKIRFRECGKPGVCDLYFDVVSGRFTETAVVYERGQVVESQNYDNDPRFM